MTEVKKLKVAPSRLQSDIADVKKQLHELRKDVPHRSDLDDEKHYSRRTRLGVFNVYKQLYRMIREETIHSTGLYVKLRSQLRKLSKDTPSSTTPVLHGETAHWARMRFFNSYPIMTDPFTLGQFSCEVVSNTDIEEHSSDDSSGATIRKESHHPFVEQVTFYPIIPLSRLL